MNTIAPEKVGLSSTRLRRINTVMQRYVDQGRIAGVATMVARRRQVAHFECFGMMDIEAKKPMRPDTIFRLFSMTKPVTGVAAMILYEEGHFQLKDPVAEYIPEFENLKVCVGATERGLELAEPKRPMTVRDLFTHTSGLSYGMLDDSPVEAMYRDLFPRDRRARADKPLKEWISKLAQIPLVYQPGTAWRYSVSTDVLGYLVEVISGLPFDMFLKQRLFEPLGMKDTDFCVPQEKVDRFAAQYAPAKNGGLELVDAPASSRYVRRPHFLSGGGGLVSTMPDYARFAQMLLNKGELDGTRLLSRKSVELMTMNHLPAELLPYRNGRDIWPGCGFGLCFRVLMDPAQYQILGSPGEFGWDGAASTYFWVDPQEELFGLMMLQFPIRYYPINEEFRVLTYQAIDD